MGYGLAPFIKQRFFDSNGNPLAGGKLYSYQSGTTTPQNTYTDSTGGTPNANPVVLDANGEANVWLDQSLSYKFVLKDSSDVTQWTVDGVIGILTVDAVNTASIQDGAVSASKLASSAVTAAKLAYSAIASQTSITTINHDDEFLLGATSLTALRKIKAKDLVAGATADTSITGADELLFHKAAASVTRRTTLTQMFSNFQASQGDMESATVSTTLVTPAKVKFNPGVAKAWVLIADNAAFGNTIGTPKVELGYNVSSLTDDGAGQYTVNFSTAFSTARHCGVGMAEHDSGSAIFMTCLRGDSGFSASAQAVDVMNVNTVSPGDPRYAMFAFFGDQ